MREGIKKRGKLNRTREGGIIISQKEERKRNKSNRTRERGEKRKESQMGEERKERNN